MIKTVETENQGLKRAFMLTIAAEDIEARVDQEVKRIAPQVRMPGFRPGKVPPNLIRKMHGDSLQRDALMELLLAWLGDVLRHQVGVERLDLPEYAAATRALAPRNEKMCGRSTKRSRATNAARAKASADATEPAPRRRQRRYATAKAARSTIVFTTTTPGNPAFACTSVGMSVFVASSKSSRPDSARMRRRTRNCSSSSQIQMSRRMGPSFSPT